MPLSDAELDAAISAGIGMKPKEAAPKAAATEGKLGETPPASAGVLDRVTAFAKGFAPPTAGPTGAAIDKLTGGAYSDLGAPRHGGIYQAPPETAPRETGESDREYALRTAHDALRDPALADRSLAVAGLVAGNAPELRGVPQAGKAPALPQSVRDWVREKSIAQGRRVLTGGANPLSVKQPLSPEATQTAFDVGAIAPLKTTEYAAKTLADARAAATKTKTGIVDDLMAAGVKGPNASQVAQALRQKADQIEEKSVDTGAPEIYRKIADELEKKVAGRPAFTPGRQNLDLDAGEGIKTSLQEKAHYDRVQGDKSLERARKDIASTVRQSVEDAIQNQAQLAPDAAAAFVPAKERLGNLIEASEIANKGAAQAARRNAFSLRDVMLGAGMSAAGAATHGPMGSLAGPAAAIVSHLARTRGTPTVAWALNRLAQAGESPGPAGSSLLGPLGAVPAGGGALSFRVSPAPASTGSGSEGQGAPGSESTTEASPANDTQRATGSQPPEEGGHANGAKLEEIIRSDPSVLGPYSAPMSVRYRTGGKKALIQYDFLQRQRDPKYRALMERLEGKGAEP